MSKLVSVIVPVYNVEQYLERCLESVVNQSYRDLEIIVVNDESPDNSQAIIDTYAERDSRIKSLSQKNTGLSGARNTGMKHAEGEYLYFLDSDDFLAHNAIEKLLINSQKADVIIGNYSIYDSTGKITRRNAIPEGAITNPTSLSSQFKFDFFFGKNYGLCAWNKLYKTGFIKSIDLLFEKNSDIYAEDLLFNIKLFIHNPQIYSINEYTYFHCVNPESITKTYKSSLHIRFFNLIESFREYTASLGALEKHSDLLTYTTCIALSNICLNDYLYNKTRFQKMREDIEWFYTRSTISYSSLRFHLHKLQPFFWRTFHKVFYFFCERKCFSFATALQYCRFLVRHY